MKVVYKTMPNLTQFKWRKNSQTSIS